MKNKYEVRNILQSFAQLIETQFDLRIKVFRNDNGPKFSMNDFYASKGIMHQTSFLKPLNRMPL